MSTERDSEFREHLQAFDMIKLGGVINGFSIIHLRSPLQQQSCEGRVVVNAGGSIERLQRRVFPIRMHPGRVGVRSRV